MDDALAQYNAYNVASDLPVLEVPAHIESSSKRYYDFLSAYIIFDEGSGEYENPEVTGSGKHIRMRAPAMQFNDIRNDPYFIIK